MGSPKSELKRRRNARGAVLVEYALLLVGVAIPTAVGITSAGYIMLQNYQQGRDAVLSAWP